MPPVSPARGFLEALDQAWPDVGTGKIRLQVIGSTALMLQFDYVRGTKDSDLLRAGSLPTPLETRLETLAGAGSTLARRHRMYLDLVAPSLLFRPQRLEFHLLVALNETLRAFEVEALDPVDVVVTKLKRFHANDLADIRAVWEQGLLDHGRLLERFRAALDACGMDAQADDFPRYVENLNQVERDLLGVAETPFDLE
jgi:hypothetical protein